MNDNWYKASAIVDIISGAVGITGTLMYDLLLNRDFRVGVHAVIAVAFFSFFIFKGIMLWALVSE